MATAARAIRCELRRQENPAISRRDPAVPVQVPVPKPVSADPKTAKIVLQPRLCTLRSYGSDLAGVMRKKDDTSPFFAALWDYIESSKKSQDFEILSGRLAMVVFAATVATEAVTGNSLFGKVELEGIAEAAGVCLAAVACAAVSAWLSSNRKNVGRVLSLSCNGLIDSLIDQIVDGLFYETTDLSDWSDEV
ncbi:stress enhanced protein 2 chloroplastic-like [Prunus yedoensis var. nudiflora]|uniref:Stress enhanced protein 2 chloroplastic-like n=1 Tax=Prunus yedoensis var. nudiflora TaxID=2094558 RepID=A0A314UFI3_PRUYE|nr:stress enhanced protein 2 chloroplastic-like [Prunus yedoensis var. nudiflora]